MVLTVRGRESICTYCKWPVITYRTKSPCRRGISHILRCSISRVWVMRSRIEALGDPITANATLIQNERPEVGRLGDDQVVGRWRVHRRSFYPSSCIVSLPSCNRTRAWRFRCLLASTEDLQPGLRAAVHHQMDMMAVKMLLK